MLWKWKLARNLDDVLHLLNGETKYDRPVPDARICMTWRGDHPQFWVFANKAPKATEPHDGLGGWGWKLATEADDALRFLRGDEPYSAPVGQAQIAAAWTGDHHLFYVFHRNLIPGHQPEQIQHDWGWKLSTDLHDALLFLNGGGTYAQPVSTARIATAHRDHHDEFFMFYQPGSKLPSRTNWQWQAVHSADAVRDAVDHKGEPRMDFQVAGPPPGNGTFQLFTRPVDRSARRAARTEQMANG
jgi:hypothetical protein